MLDPKIDTKPQLDKKLDYKNQIAVYRNRLSNDILFNRIVNAKMPDVLKIRWLSRIVQDIEVSIPTAIEAMEIEINSITKSTISASSKTAILNKYTELGIDLLPYVEENSKKTGE